MASALFRSDVAQAPLSILHSPTREKIASMLDSKKILLSDFGIHRDWRGIAEQAGLVVPAIRATKISPLQHCIHLWAQKGGLVSELWTALEKMDRFDVIDDTIHYIYQDYDKTTCAELLPVSTLPQTINDGPIPLDEFDSNILTYDDQENLKQGRGVQHYDALVLYSDEDIDFVDEMVSQLEGEYKLNLCLIQRDLICGLQFEYEAVTRLIKERCSRVIVVLSQEFISSDMNKYFIHFAAGIGVGQRKRLLIPCKAKPCTKPDTIHFMSSLDYFRAQLHPKWNFWKQLAKAVERTDKISPASISTSSPHSLTETSSKSVGIFSRFYKKSNSNDVPQVNNEPNVPENLNTRLEIPIETVSSSQINSMEPESFSSSEISELSNYSVTEQLINCPSPPTELPQTSSSLPLKDDLRTRVQKVFHKVRKKKRAKESIVSA